MSDLPKYINVMRVVSYDVEVIAESCREHLDKDEEITLEDVMFVVEGLAVEDFGNTRGLIFQDENGNDL